MDGFMDYDDVLRYGDAQDKADAAEALEIARRFPGRTVEDAENILRLASRIVQKGAMDALKKARVPSVLP